MKSWRKIYCIFTGNLIEKTENIVDLSKCLQKERRLSVFIAKHFNNYALKQWFFFVSQIPLCLQATQLNVIRISQSYFHIVWRLAYLLHSHMLIWKKNIYNCASQSMGSILESKAYRLPACSASLTLFR